MLKNLIEVLDRTILKISALSRKIQKNVYANICNRIKSEYPSYFIKG